MGDWAIRRRMRTRKIGGEETRGMNEKKRKHTESQEIEREKDIQKKKDGENRKGGGGMGGGVFEMSNECTFTSPLPSTWLLIIVLISGLCAESN